MELLKSLQWRYNARHMNGHTIPTEKLSAIMEAIRLAPTAFNLQPFTVVVISSIKTKNELQAMAGGQPSVHQSSHLMIFAAWADVTLRHVHEHITNTAAVHQLPEAVFDEMKGRLLSVVHQPKEENLHWSTQQAFIALGVALVAAAEQRVDVATIENSNHDAVDKYLGLKTKGLKTVAMLALGFRDEADQLLAEQPKVRRSNEKLFITHQVVKSSFDRTLLL